MPVPPRPPRSPAAHATWAALAVLTFACERQAQSEPVAKVSEEPREEPTRARTARGVWARIANLRAGGKSRVRYTAPSEAEATSYAAWVTSALQAAVDERPAPEAPEGFELSEYESGTLWLLSERQEKRRGAGAVVLRVGDAKPLLVEAPHTFFDEGTLPLARETFERSQARALVLNTAHRGNLAQGQSETELEEASRGGELASDVAHAARSFFQAAHVSLTAGSPHAATVQLHGYRDGVVPADAVVSAAGSELDVAPLVEQMRRLCPTSGIAQYGRDTKRLGGTTNVQAKAARSQGRPFLHLELSHSLRSRLRSEEPLREELIDAMMAALQG